MLDAKENDSSKPSPLNATNVNSVSDSDSDSDSVHMEKPYQPAQTVTDEEYLHGLRLVILAGASLIAVFLVELDQVRTSFAYSDTESNL